MLADYRLETNLGPLGQTKSLWRTLDGGQRAPIQQRPFINEGNEHARIRIQGGSCFLPSRTETLLVYPCTIRSLAPAQVA